LIFHTKVKNGHRVEVLTSVKGTSIQVSNDSGDMYASIDSAAHALNRKLRKYKERRTEGWHGGANMGKDLLAALESLEEVDLPPPPAGSEEDDTFVDPEAKKITKINSFDLSKPMSVEEAVFALDYVDHDFYVFKNEANDKITVVYKRNVGGIGLIEPE
jgi:putative sigma-54 modulation protein